MEPVVADVSCPCGDRAFQVRLDKNEQVGLVTCSAGHISLLLDSRDHWIDVLQDGRPPVAKCRCKSDRFALSLRYHFRADEVSLIDVLLRCSACARDKHGATFEIDYAPTETLLSSPLDPCAAPWEVPRRRSYTCLWTPADVERALVLVGHETSRIWFVECDAPPRLVDVDEARARVVDALTRHRPYEVLFANSDVDLAGPKPRAWWKSFPVIQLGSPTHMHYSIDVSALLHYLEYAEQVVVEGAIVAQPRELLDFAKRVVRRLGEEFVSSRGRHTLDSPTELARVARARGLD